MKDLLINQEIETVKLNGMVVTLLAASKDGTEIIRHRLEKGKRWGISPQDGWDSLEYIHILQGQLSLTTASNEHLLTLLPGDFCYANPVIHSSLFVADEFTEFLYVSSQPVFHFYSKVLKGISDLAIRIEEKDGYKGHCSRISSLCLEIGQAFKLPYTELLVLNFAAYLHDVGKVCIPDSILNKEEPLTEIEWEIIRRHSTFGKEILTDTNIPILEKAGQVVEQHHERFDGKGYPFGLKGDAIDLRAAIIAVVDSYDAMTVNRVYQKARSPEEAVEEIRRGRGILYHPQVVDTFLAVLRQRELATQTTS